MAVIRNTANLILCLLVITQISLVYCEEDYDYGLPSTEICQGETFAPTCGADEVLYINYAEYGHVRSGRCVQGDSFRKCDANVAEIVTSRCSGRRTCNISIPDPEITETFQAEKPCVGLVSPYLYVEHRCLKVLKPDLSQCSENDEFFSVPLPEGFIASVISLEIPCGRSSNPWRIDIRPDESVMLSITNFGQTKYSNTRSNADANICHLLAEVKEVMTGKEEAICEEIIHTTRPIYDGPIEIIVHPETESGPNYFIIDYEVFGCPDIPPISGATIRNWKKWGFITCEDTSSDLESRIICIGKKWYILDPEHTMKMITTDDLLRLCANKMLVN